MIVGLPLKPIAYPNRLPADDVTVTFKDWRSLYCKTYRYRLPFDLEHRTFRLAIGATGEA